MFDNTNTKIQGHLSKKLRKIKINVDPPPCKSRVKLLVLIITLMLHFEEIHS